MPNQPKPTPIQLEIIELMNKLGEALELDSRHGPVVEQIAFDLNPQVWATIEKVCRGAGLTDKQKASLAIASMTLLTSLYSNERSYLIENPGAIIEHKPRRSV